MGFVLATDWKRQPLAAELAKALQASARSSDGSGSALLWRCVLYRSQGSLQLLWPPAAYTGSREAGRAAWWPAPLAQQDVLVAGHQAVQRRDVKNLLISCCIYGSQAVL
jgi:hypothetical protein